MQISYLFLALGILTLFAFYVGKHRSVVLAKPLGGIYKLHSLPNYYGYLVAIWCAIPALIIAAFWVVMEESIITKLIVVDLPVEASASLSPNLSEDERVAMITNEIKNVANNENIFASNQHIAFAANRYQELRDISHMALTVLALVVAIIAILIARARLDTQTRARSMVEKVLLVFLIICSTVAIFTTIGIVLSVLFESVRFFQKVSPFEFLFGTKWSTQTALRADQVGASGSFGAVPLFTGTLLISFIGMLVAAPIGLLSAIFMAEYASPRFRATAKPIIEILAGIPTVVFGFFAALTVAPIIRDTGSWFGFSVASECALAAGLVMGFMLIPFVSSLSDDVINAVPQSLRDGAYALGATQSETIRQVVLPAALPGIVGSLLLAISRAIGETMIVVMAAGLSANLTANPFEAVTTVTVQMVTLLVGDQEFDSAKTLAAFALGLFLFIVTLILNIIALVVVRKYREQYD